MFVSSRKLPPLSMAMALFYCGAVLAAFTSYDWRLCVPFLAVLSVGLGVYAMLTLSLHTDKHVTWVSAILVLLACLYAIICVFQYRHLGWNDKISLFTRLGNLLSTPFPALIQPGLTANAAAALLEGCLPLALGLCYDARGWRRVIWLAAAMLLVVVILLSASRGAWLALLVTAAVAAIWFVFFRPHQATPPIHIRLGSGLPLAVSANRLSRKIILAFVALIAALLALKALSALFAYTTLARAIERLGLYRDSFYLALEFPFTGIGGGPIFAQMYSHFQLLINVPYLEYAHNLWLNIWLAHGLLGLLGFSGLLLAAIRLVWRALPQLNGAGFGAALGSLSLMLHGFTDAPQYDSKWPVLLMAFALFGLLIAATRVVNAQPLCWINLRFSEVYRASGSDIYTRQRWPHLRIVIIGIALFSALGIYMPTILALAASNVAAVFHAKAQLGPSLSDAERMHMLAQVDGWLDTAQRIRPQSAAVLRKHGMLAFQRGNYAETIWLLSRAAPAYPDDQGLIKTLGLAYTWYGYTQEGAQILGQLSRANEVRQELEIWAVAWTEREQEEYANNSRVVATLLNAHIP